MDVFEVREAVIREYSEYISSFLRIRDAGIEDYVRDEMAGGRLWPDPLIGLNPSFEPGQSVDELVDRGLLAPGCRRIFRRKDAETGEGPSLRLHRHQQEALEVARGGSGSYVLTTGTGSGKSLAYFLPIIDHVLRQGGSRRGITAIVVYPMNALCNSQLEELRKYLERGFAPGQQPVTFARYTGQERDEERGQIAANPPDILLTNFMMLELLLTRTDTNDQHLIGAASGLQFLVLDELHTYRGRQGADVAMLVRRVRERCGAPTMRCIGTSATIASAGTREERAAEVGAMATKLFGDTVLPQHVIGETLRTAISRQAPTAGELRDALGEPAVYRPEYATLIQHPLAAWAERAFGLARDAQGRLERRRPISISAAAEALAAETRVDAARCREHLQAVLLAGYKTIQPDTGLPLSAFRLHQFVSRGDTVYTSIEPPESRYLSMEGQVYVPDGTRSRRLYPLAFCRECGQDYLVVDLQRQPVGNSIEPRDLSAVTHLEDGSQISGFLLQDPEERWEPSEDTLPEDWLELARDGSVRVKSANRKWQPRKVFVAPGGEWGDIGVAGGMAAWFLPAPFRFCLNCQVTYTSFARSDFGKLASLSTEGRSTATTVLSLAIVRALRGVEGLPRSAQKLLSFTDNRQDASLQAGHANDFIQVGLLRAALFAAVDAAGPEGLGHDEIARKVTAHLGLDLREYATNPEAQFAARTATNNALADVVGYRIYRDLRRGWRVTSPNLEQCGLLKVAYEALDELCAAEEVWGQRHALLRDARPAERERVCRVVLDTLRRGLAIKVPYLEPAWQEGLRNKSYQFLREPWGLADEEELDTSPAFRLGPRPRGHHHHHDTPVSATSGLGRYLRRPSTWPSSLGPGGALPAKEFDALARDIFGALVIGGQLEALEAGAPVYRLQAGVIRWLPGDGSPPEPDPVSVPRPPKDHKDTEANAFFREFYQHVALTLHGTVAREHTAQVPAKVREEREQAFRAGDLPILYCSPTMELGVDIADLNAVNMRNVPPTPANYAQRSGRAGRSGQPALVLTYCSSTSPHDQYFFRRQQQMVAGAVATPRLDLQNEDLVRAHLHAVWLAETGTYLGQSLRDILDLEGVPASLELAESVRHSLTNPQAQRRAMERCGRVLEALEPQLAGTSWYRPGWLESTMGGAVRQLDAACERWRTLYRAACRQRDGQNAIIMDASASAESTGTAKRMRAEAETQIALLLHDTQEVQSDFYSYRYFASEGFLPGYNFPRLPLAAYLPGRTRSTGRDEFVSRPRFLAVSEFGPRSIIYHEGSRFRVNRVILPVHAEDGERVTVAKFCNVCGYAHFGTESQAELCHDCGNLLSGGGAHYLGNLLKLDNVSTRRVDRITSDEEERLRQGYEIKTALRFAENSQGLVCVRTAYLGAGIPLARSNYAPTATLWRLNLGWNRRQEQGKYGFYLDMERGYWSKSESPDEQQTADEAGGQGVLKRVVPFVEDRRNAFVFWPEGKLEQASMASLEYALKRGIESCFQLEERELASEPLPSIAQRHRILFFEASEGGAGVLSRLAEEPRALAWVAREALSICHFAEDGSDLGRATGAAEPCAAACYDCLLSYGNQREHRLLDRHLVRDILLALATSVGEARAGARERDELLDGLLARCDSELERRFLRFLAVGDMRLPDQVQHQLGHYQTRPDFFYSASDLQACVYVDGPYHEFPDRQRRDAQLTERLEDGGYQVIRLQGEEGWPDIVGRYAWVFGGNAQHR